MKVNFIRLCVCRQSLFSVVRIGWNVLPCHVKLENMVGHHAWPWPKQAAVSVTSEAPSENHVENSWKLHLRCNISLHVSQVGKSCKF